MCLLFTGDDNYDEDDTKLMPPPNWIPGHSLEPNQSNQSSPEKSEQGSPDSKKNLSPGSAAKLKTPLAGMLPPELADKDVTELFPEFKQGQVKYADYLSMNLSVCLSIYPIYLSIYKITQFKGTFLEYSW